MLVVVIDFDGLPQTNGIITNSEVGIKENLFCCLPRGNSRSQKTVKERNFRRKANLAVGLGINDF
jgi:hypothetical protein